MKILTMFAAAFLAMAASAATTVTDVSAHTRWPWNGLVDVDFTIGGPSVADLYKVEVRAVYDGGAKTIYARTYLNEPLVGPGTHRVTWDLGADCPGLKANDLQVAVVAAPLSAAGVDASSVYMVIDLSGGPDASRYPVRYTTNAPTLVPTNDLVACAADPNRTTKLWLKRVKSNTFPFGGTTNGNHGEGEFKARLSPFYLGIFELTQKQWNLVMGNWPSQFSNETYRAARPVERINYEDVIGHNNWPNNKVVSDSSFVGKMRARTGLATLNLPTEAQWEDVARAGATGSVYANGTTGRYDANSGSPSTYNEDPTVGTALVGSYKANNWGFYDCYGNVMEMCLDAYASGDDLKALYAGQNPVDDPIGPSTYSTARYHATRGGSYYNSNSRSSSYDRFYCNNSTVTGTRDCRIGMRVAVSPDWQ